MRIDVSKMSDLEVRKVVKNFKDAPCIICEKPSTSYRKLHFSHEVAILPVCDQCKDTDALTLFKFMEMANHGGTIGPRKGLGYTFRSC